MSAEYKAMREKYRAGNADTNTLEKDYLTMSQNYKNIVPLHIFKQHFSQNKPATLLWHDYEGGGVHATISPSTQFAAVRTDANLNIVDTPIDIFCQPPIDNLIHPEAAILTGLSPLMLMEKGLAEHDYFGTIYNEMIVANTCTVGYNSLSYDDEMTRAGFYRNLFPMYKREFTESNSRWDLYPVTMAYYAVRPNGIIFPSSEDGSVSLKLENIALANNITQESAHNAVDDVYALIGLAKLLKASNPKLWQYLYSNRSKQSVQHTINDAIKKNQPLLHVTSFAGKDNHYVQLIKPVSYSTAKGGSNTLIAIKLDDTLELWTEYSPNDAKDALYATKEELSDKDMPRPGIVSLKINQMPILLPASLCNEPAVAEKLNFNESVKGKLVQWRALIQSASSLAKVVLNQNNDFPIPPYIDTALYSYGFPGRADEMVIENNMNLTSNEYANKHVYYEAQHFQVLHMRKLVALDSSLINEKDKLSFIEHAKQRVLEPKDARASLTDVLDSLETIEPKNDKQRKILADYDVYLSHIDKSLSLTACYDNNHERQSDEGTEHERNRPKR